MASVSFHVVDGVDKGRSFLNIPTPITIGREEGNIVRLNDERVSRFHAKIQEDHGQVVLTDLDSTNGTCVNGESIQLRLLRPGDRVCVGRSTLVFGTLEEIAESLKNGPMNTWVGDGEPEDVTPGGDPASASHTKNGDVSSSGVASSVGSEVELDVFERKPPPLPANLSPAQAAQFSEVIDYLHRGLAQATRYIHIPKRSREARLPIANWQQIQAVLTFLATYSRQIGDPAERTTGAEE